MTETAIPEAMRRPVDWAASHLGKDIWLAWNALDAALSKLGSAQMFEVSERFVEAGLARDRMAKALAQRDQMS